KRIVIILVIVCFVIILIISIVWLILVLTRKTSNSLYIAPLPNTSFTISDGNNSCLGIDNGDLVLQTCGNELLSSDNIWRLNGANGNIYSSKTGQLLVNNGGNLSILSTPPVNSMDAVWYNIPQGKYG